MMLFVSHAKGLTTGLLWHAIGTNGRITGARSTSSKINGSQGDQGVHKPQANGEHEHPITLRLQPAVCSVEFTVSEDFAPEQGSLAILEGPSSLPRHQFIVFIDHGEVESLEYVVRKRNLTNLLFTTTCGVLCSDSVVTINLYQIIKSQSAAMQGFSPEENKRKTQHGTTETRVDTLSNCGGREEREERIWERMRERESGDIST
ncbi:hypothetical protein RB195_005926 [Necator americanus]|uniref:Uncharacterized protein n=1 Tax=Necator americanus TaxID=51031 RepID=A0ABR1BTL0_NECAM